MLSKFSLLWVGLFLLCLTERASFAQTIDIGKTISEKHCSRCHIVSDSNPFGGISSTPSFSLLVNALEDWEERFLSFYVLRPHPAFTRIEGIDNPLAKQPSMVPVEMTLEEVDAIVEFAQTLKKTQ